MAQKTIRLPRAERRRQILTVAAAAFAERGFGGVTMEEIAGRVGVTRLILYRAFASKEDLYRAILHDTAARLTAAMTEAVSLPGAPSGAALRAYLDTARHDPAAFMLLFTGAAESPLGIEIDAARRRVREEIAQQALAQAAKEGVSPRSLLVTLDRRTNPRYRRARHTVVAGPAPLPAADDAFVSIFSAA